MFQPFEVKPLWDVKKKKKSWNIKIKRSASQRNIILQEHTFLSLSQCSHKPWGTCLTVYNYFILQPRNTVWTVNFPEIPWERPSYFCSLKTEVLCWRERRHLRSRYPVFRNFLSIKWKRMKVYLEAKPVGACCIWCSTKLVWNNWSATRIGDKNLWQEYTPDISMYSFFAFIFTSGT